MNDKPPNSTWDLIDNGLCELSPREEQEQALHAAYAAAYDWMQAALSPPSRICMQRLAATPW